jgi:hypothetical protein
MTRRIESKETIGKLIVAETIQHADCVNVTWNEVFWHAPDETGCNWGISVANHYEGRACIERMQAFIDHLRATVNLPEKER